MVRFTWTSTSYFADRRWVSVSFTYSRIAILRPYGDWDDKEQRRYLLYNAITRAKKNCIVFVAKKESVAISDPVQNRQELYAECGRRTTK